MSIDLSRLLTERRNASSANTDTLSTLDMLTVINQEDQRVAQAITPYLPQIVRVVDRVATALQADGRLIYIDTGTSGCLEIPDASEYPPTFDTRPEQVVGIIADGHKAIFSTMENMEDNKAQRAMDLQNLNFSHRDVLAGLAASEHAPYVIGVIEYTHSQNAFVAIVSCNPHDKVIQPAGVAITPVVDPKVVIGSTCLKAGTTQKLVLNMISIGVMIHVGEVYSSLMVDVEAANAKLIERQVSIVMEATDRDHLTARKALKACGHHCKTVIVMVLVNLSAEATQSLPTKSNGHIRKAFSNT